MILLSLEILCPVCGSGVRLSSDEVVLNSDDDGEILCSFDCPECDREISQEVLEG